jgi:SAM-dependent methyltransferase
MIDLAKQRHPNVTFHHADICAWEFPRKYDFISAWDSIWHLPLAQQEPVLKKILHGLPPGGVFIFTTGGLDTPSEKVDSAMGPQMYYSVPVVVVTSNVSLLVPECLPPDAWLYISTFREFSKRRSFPLRR